MRFPSYSSEWHSYTLGEILTFYSTNSFSREKLNYDTGSVKNIHYGDIHTKFPSIVSVSDNKDIPFINNEIDLSKYSEDQYLQNGDLIIADASEDYEDIGKAIEVKNIDDEKVLAGLHTILARDNNNITVNGFKAYLFSTNSLKTKIKIIANGISVLGISKNSLSKLTVNVPSKNEQNDVVDFISLIDNKIELLEQKHQYYLDFKKFLMQQIFTQKLRFNFTDDWNYMNFSEIFKSVSTKKYQIKSADILDKGDFEVIDQGQDEIAGYFNDKTKLCQELPIIIYGDHTTFVKFRDKPFIVGADGVKLLIPKFNANPKYLFYALEHFNIKPEGYKRHFSIIKKIKLPIPTLEEQNEISEVFTYIDIKLKYTKIQLQETEEFKKGLLQQMFIVRINWRCNFKLAKSPSFNKHLLILKNKIIFIIIK